MPPAVVTVMSTVPAPAGEVAVMDVAVLAVKPVAAVAPNFTPVAALKLVPVMTTVVPPAVGPLEVLMLVTVGTATETVKPAVRTATSAPVVTVTSRAVAAAAPEIVMLAVAWVPSVTVRLLTVIPVPEKVRTEVPWTKFVLVPTMASEATVAPCAPLVGATEARDGGA